MVNQKWEEPLDKTKPYDISKHVVWEAYLRVKANKGAAGIDEQSVADFERELKNNLYKIWNRMSSGSYFPPPVQNPYAERVIGSIRRECLDHLIIIGEDQLRRTLRDYLDYYHKSRPHQALERNSPTPREIEAPKKGKVIAIPQVGGLHHRYQRAA